MVKWSFPGSLYFENPRKNLKSNLVLEVVLVFKPEGLFYAGKRIRPKGAISMMASFYYYDQDPVQGFVFFGTEAPITYNKRNNTTKQ